jgi:hemerythrin
MKLKWSDGLLTGNELIDKQHKGIFEGFNRFCETAERGVGGTELIGIANSLEQSMLQHLKDEEQIQIDTQFPNYAIHKKEHDQFKDRFSKFKNELCGDTSAHSAIAGVITIVADKISAHVHTRDKELGSYLRERGNTPTKSKQ